MSRDQKKKLNKSVGVQLFIAVSIFVVAISTSLVGYVNEAKNNATISAYNDMEEIVTEYANSVRVAITDCSDIARVVADFIDNSAGEPIAPFIDALYSLEYTDDIYIVNENGIGRGMHHLDADFSHEEFWLGKLDDVETQVIPRKVEDKKNSIMILTAIKPNDYGVSYVVVEYSAERFLKSVNQTDFDTQAIFMLTANTGDVLAVNHSKSPFANMANLVDEIDSTNPQSDEIRNAITKGEVAHAIIEKDAEKRVVINVPAGEYPVNVTVAVKESHLKYRVKKQTKELTELERLVFIYIFAYVIGLVVILLRYRQRYLNKNKQLVEKADTDLLTGLYNKLATERKIIEYIENHPDDPGMFIIFDIDKFKKINDTQGHAFGDEVLRTLGERVSSQFRVTDILGRIGGDEFMIFLKNIPSEEIARREAEKLMLFFKDFKAGSEYVKYSATASVGVAMFPQDGETFEQLYKAADDALYRSKENGRNQLNFANKEWGTIVK